MFGSLLRPFIAQRKRGRLIDKLVPTQEQDVQVEQLVQEEDQFNRELLINVLTATTAIVHISYGGPLFVLNGLGFLTFLAVRRVLPHREAYQKYARDGLFGYTGITVVAYFLKYGYNGFTMYTGLTTKMVELLLMYTLWQDRQAAKAGQVVEMSNLDMLQAKLDELSENAAAA